MIHITVLLVTSWQDSALCKTENIITHMINIQNKEYDW